MFALDLLPWGITCLALSLLVVNSVMHGRRLRRQTRDWQQSLDALRDDMVAVNSGAIGVGRKVQGQEKLLTEIRNGLEEIRQNDPMRVSYHEASRLVEMGADVDDLMNSCGISRPEAELVSALFQQRQGVTLN